MKQVKKLKQLETLAFFNVTSIKQITSIEGDVLYENISRWIQNGTLIQLKKGLYTTSNYYKNMDKKDIYAEFISNKLKYPSYLSLEYVLSKYQILSESVYSYTSVTKKTPNTYSNILGTFSYRNISDKLFTGFEIFDKGEFEIAIASKSKALFDYLYLKLYRKEEITKEMISDLRLNLEEFNKNDIKEFEKYCNLVNIEKFKTLSKLLFEKNDN